MKTASTGSLTVLVTAALVSALMVAPGAADSIGTLYNMDKMLFEPHPLADQYGTRWQAPPASAPAYAPGATPAPANAPARAPAYAPAYAPGATPAPAQTSTPSPFPAIAPEPPLTTFAPPEPSPLGETAPPQPVPLAQPVAKVIPVESLAEPSPPPVMAPRLSIDAGGINLEPEVMKKPGEREFEQPGPRPPPPSITPPG